MLVITAIYLFMLPSLKELIKKKTLEIKLYDAGTNFID